MTPKNQMTWESNSTPNRIGVDKHGRETRYYLWHEPYLVRAPRIQLMSEYELRNYGILDSGSPLENRLTMNELHEVMLPIVKIMYHVENGTHISVVKHSDTEWIYRRIQDHLHAWMQYLDTSLNISHAPIEDLIRLDKFAQIIYPHATEHFTAGYVESKFMAAGNDSFARMTQVLSMFDMGRSTVEHREKTNERGDNYPRRVSPIEKIVRSREGLPMQVRGPNGQFTDVSAPSSGLNQPSLNQKQDKRPSMGDFLRPS